MKLQYSRTHTRYVDITNTTEQSPSIRIQQISQKAQQRANGILRCFVSGDVKVLVRVYVRPVLEYNSVIVQLVQRQFTKRLGGFQHIASDLHGLGPVAPSSVSCTVS